MAGLFAQCSSQGTWVGATLDGVAGTDSAVDASALSTTTTITIDGFGLLTGVSDYTCNFRTGLILCPMLPTYPTMVCGETEERSSPATILSPFRATCTIPAWDLPSMYVQMELKKADSPLRLDWFYKTFRIFAEVGSLTPTQGGAGGGVTVTFSGAGFDSFPDQTAHCDFCDAQASYGCRFVGASGRLITGSVAVVTGTTSVTCTAPEWPYDAEITQASLLRGGSPIVTAHDFAYFDETRPFASTVTAASYPPFASPVAVAGFGFVTVGSAYTCRWSAGTQSIDTEPSAVTNNVILCLTPTWTLDNRTASLSLLRDGATVATRAPLNVSMVPALLSVSARAASAEGGENLTFVGFGMYSDGEYEAVLSCTGIVTVRFPLRTDSTNTSRLHGTVPYWPYEACTATVTVELMDTQGGSGTTIFGSAQLEIVPRLFSVDELSGPFLGGSRVYLRGLAFASASAFECRFVGISGNSDISVPYADCTCDNGCRSYRCIPGVWASHELVYCEVPDFPARGVANFSVYLDATPLLVATSGQRFFTFEFTAQYWTGLDVSAASIAAAANVTVLGSFPGNGFFTCLFTKGQDAISSNATWLSSSSLRCPSPAPWPFLSGLSVVTVHNGSETVAKIGAEQPFEFVGVASGFDRRRFSLFESGQMVVYGGGFASEATYRCVFAPDCPSACAATETAATLLSSTTLSCTTPVWSYQRASLSVSSRNTVLGGAFRTLDDCAGDALCAAADYSLQERVHFLGTISSFSPRFVPASGGLEITAYGSGLTAPGSNYSCLFVARSHTSLAYNVSATAAVVAVSDLNLGIQPSSEYPFQDTAGAAETEYLLVQDELMAVVGQLSLEDFAQSGSTTSTLVLAVTVAGVGGSVTTLDHNALIGAMVTLDNGELSEIVGYVGDTDGNGFLNGTGEATATVSPAWSTAPTAGTGYNISGYRVERGALQTRADTHMINTSVTAAAYADATPGTDTQLSCGSHEWPFSDPLSTLSVFRDGLALYSEVPSNASEVFHSVSSWQPQLLQANGSALGGHTLVLSGERFCYLDTACTANSFRCDFELLTSPGVRVVSSQATILSASSLQCTTPAWPLQAVTSRVMLTDTSNSSISGPVPTISSVAALYTFHEDISHIEGPRNMSGLPVLPASTGASITVVGAGFDSSDSYACMLHVITTAGVRDTLAASDPATVASSQEIVCTFHQNHPLVAQQTANISLSKTAPSGEILVQCTVALCFNGTLQVLYAEGWYSASPLIAFANGCTSSCSSPDNLLSLSTAAFDPDQLYACYWQSESDPHVNRTSSYQQPLLPSLFYCELPTWSSFSGWTRLFVLHEGQDEVIVDLFDVSEAYLRFQVLPIL